MYKRFFESFQTKNQNNTTVEIPIFVHRSSTKIFLKGLPANGNQDVCLAHDVIAVHLLTIVTYKVSSK
jgi:hypothetical protein